ncbi:MAG: hypothetical protein ACYTHJ_22060 [Planctomycetota bacterium]|jgi:hypothetical protein
MKRSLIVMLAGINLILLVALVFAADSTPKAFAQGARPGDFACVAAKPANQNFDIIYVLDRNGEKLLAYAPTGQQRMAPFGLVGIRDLKEDFAGR